jgi:hypothetical protein
MYIAWNVSVMSIIHNLFNIHKLLHKYNWTSQLKPSKHYKSTTLKNVQNDTQDRE